MALMEVGHSVTDANGDLDALPVGEALILLVEEVEEVAVAVDYLLHEVEGAVLHTHTQELDDPRMLQRPHHLTLSTRPSLVLSAWLAMLGMLPS